LIENGVSYLVWEKGLKRRLLMEKVIRKDVSENSFQVPLPADKVVTTAMDANFEAQISLDEEAASGDETVKTRNAASKDVPEGAAEAPDETVDTAAPEGENELDFSRTAAENEAESEYAAWIGRLKEQYTIEIDWKLWEEIEQEDIGDT